MNTTSSLDISRVFSNQPPNLVFSRLLDAVGFPTTQPIGKIGPQVSGIMECESVQPFFWTSHSEICVGSFRFRRLGFKQLRVQMPG